MITPNEAPEPEPGKAVEPAEGVDPAEAVDPVTAAEPAAGRPLVTAAYGEPVVHEGVTVIPVAETYDFGGIGAVAGARPRGFIEIRNGSATYKPLRPPWKTLAAPLAAFAVGAAVPALARRLAGRRWGR
ncbi:sporulation protein [Streptomyces mesophilus]|uniref:sporulation protein n=1 Tax=Streptomyces mesophilus TaxID=1775132 RepID=UPI003324E11A